MLALRFNGPRLARSFDTNMESLLGDFWNALPGSRDSLSPTSVAESPLNVWEDENNIYAEAALPGVASDDVDITVAGNELTIKGERNTDHEEGDIVRRRERVQTKFLRTVRLPIDIDVDQISAKLKDGMLLVTLPKADSAKPKRITVDIES